MTSLLFALFLVKNTACSEEIKQAIEELSLVLGVHASKSILLWKNEEEKVFFCFVSALRVFLAPKDNSSCR